MNVPIIPKPSIACIRGANGCAKRRPNAHRFTRMVPSRPISQNIKLYHSDLIPEEARNINNHNTG